MSRLNLRLLGAPRIESDGQMERISRRKALALLAYLAVTGSAHSRDSLTAFFWPDFDQSSAYAYLRTTLWTLNKSLGGDWLDAERDTVALRPGYHLDVARFRELAAGDDAARLAEAAAVYQGDFMAGFALPDSPEFDEWQLFQRENLRRELGDALRRLSACLSEGGEFEAALPHARRWLALDPLHEPAHRQLMLLYAWSGQLSAALRQYQDCADLLRRELGVQPEAETTALFHAIQERRAPPPARSAPTITRAALHSGPVYTLPAQTTPFVGRDRELDDITRLLADPNCRLLTLVGPGGIGKTRLSLQTAALAAEHYPHGACFVPLAPVSADEYLLPALADALRFTGLREGDPKRQLVAYLAEKRLLLVMDNFEHLLDGAELVAEMLRAAPGLTVLATSRERLGLQEEWLYEIQGLPYPSNTDEPNLDGYDAVRLFIGSARRLRPNFKLAEADKPAVIRICQLVDGMPLGVELAAAWLPMLSPPEIVAEIERSPDFLASSTRNLPSRHRSLRAVFESSWERLSPLERRVLSKLAIFRGGFTLEAAQAVTDDASLPLLLALVGKSLVRRSAGGRFEMHELLRQFAEEKLNDAERERAYDNHSVYYAGFMRDRETQLKGAGQIAALNAIEAEIDNIRIAWHRAFDKRITTKIGGLVTGLMLFYTMRSRLQESKELFGWAMEQAQPAADADVERRLFGQMSAALAFTYRRLGHTDLCLAFYRQAALILNEVEAPEAALSFFHLGALALWPKINYSEAERWARKALAAYERLNDRWGIALATQLFGDIAHDQIHYDESQRRYQESLDIRRQIGDTWGISLSLKALGEVAYTLGDYRQAEQLYREGLELSQAVGDLNEVAYGLDRLAESLSLQGHYEPATELVHQSIAAARQAGNRTTVAWSTFHLGLLAMEQGNYEEADRLSRESIAQFQALDHPQGMGWALQTLSRIMLLTGDPAEARRLAEQSLALFETDGSPWGQSGAYYCLGQAYLAMNDIEPARFHLRLSIALAAGAKSVMMLTVHLVEVARLWATAGEPARAAELLAFVLRHPASWFYTRQRAERLLRELPLDETARAAARARGETRLMEDVVSEVIESLL
jgi:predicted ATPase/DNA-binding SARP family transcriptional activator